jgi:DNA-binding CsgD family transcriptional regulator
MKAKAQVELTPREIEIVRLIWEEYSTKEIAVKLGISPRTVEAHRWNLAQKVSAKSKVDILKFALRAGIIKL